MKYSLKYILLLLIVQACQTAWHVKENSAQHYDLRGRKTDSVSAITISPYKIKLDNEMKTVIAYSDSALTRDGNQPTVGNFMMQAIDHYVLSHHPQQHLKSVIIINRGGLRNDIPKGNITKGNIFELMPFDNEIVILTLKGDKLKECIDAMNKNKKLLAFNIDRLSADSKSGNINFLGEPIDITKEYLVVTSDYLSNGGDNCSFFTNPVKQEVTSVKIRDAIISYCEFLTSHKQHIKPFTNGKIGTSK